MAEHTVERQDSDPEISEKAVGFHDLGFAMDQALQLARTPGLYVSNVRELLLRRGCSIETAWRILKP